MSELKAKRVVDVYDEYSANPYKEAQVYLKSEADKVIAELKAREDVLVTDNRNLLDKVKNLENQLRENAEHYKRNELQILENSDKVIAELRENNKKAFERDAENWNRLCVKYNKLIELKKDFCEKFKDIELEIDK